MPLAARFSSPLFLLAFAGLAAHEIDAASHAEWRLLYILRAMDEALAAQIFVAAHVPLFAVLIWACFTAAWSVRAVSRMLFAGFCIIHAGLHYRLSDDPLYTFAGPVSQTLIYGTAACGAAYLVARWLSRGRA